MAADGVGTAEIVRRVGLSKPAVIGWKRRYAAEGVAGLDDRPKSGRPRVIDSVPIVLATLEPPPPQLRVTHWSSRLLARHLGVSDFTVSTTWKRWGLQPWRVQTFKFSTDPELEAKIRDVIGLYLNPPERGLSVLDQCVTPSCGGGGLNVATTICVSSTRRGRPARGRSASPASPAPR